MKPKFVYHGSPIKILGKKLIPKKAKDLGEHSENIHKAVYATNIKNIGIAMAIINSKGVHGASLRFGKKPYGTIYKGQPKQKYIYLYVLPAKTFKQMGGKGKQWASFKKVKPIKIEKLEIKKHKNLVRHATKKEAELWYKKYQNKIIRSKK